MWGRSLSLMLVSRLRVKEEDVEDLAVESGWGGSRFVVSTDVAGEREDIVPTAVDITEVRSRPSPPSFSCMQHTIPIPFPPNPLRRHPHPAQPIRPLLDFQLPHEQLSLVPCRSPLLQPKKPGLILRPYLTSFLHGSPRE